MSYKALNFRYLKLSLCVTRLRNEKNEFFMKKWIPEKKLPRFKKKNRPFTMKMNRDMRFLNFTKKELKIQKIESDY